MKKTLNLSLLAVVAMFLVSCGDDDGDSAPTLAQHNGVTIGGQWFRTTVRYEGFPSEYQGSNGVGVLSTLELFMDQNTYSVLIPSDLIEDYRENGTYTIENDVFTFVSDNANNRALDGEYQIDILRENEWRLSRSINLSGVTPDSLDAYISNGGFTEKQADSIRSAAANIPVPTTEVQVYKRTRPSTN